MKPVEVGVTKKKKKPIGLDDVAKAMADKLTPGMEALAAFPGGQKLKKKKKLFLPLSQTISEEIDEQILNDLHTIAKKTRAKKPKVGGVASGWTGSGWGGREPGRKLGFADLQTGMVVLQESRQFQARNVVKIVEPPKDFVKFPDRKYGVFVDPKDTMRLRMQSDQMFCIWDFDFHSEHRVYFEV